MYNVKTSNACTIVPPDTPLNTFPSKGDSSAVKLHCYQATQMISREIQRSASRAGRRQLCNVLQLQLQLQLCKLLQLSEQIRPVCKMTRKSQRRSVFFVLFVSYFFCLFVSVEYWHNYIFRKKISCKQNLELSLILFHMLATSFGHCNLC